MKLVGYCSSDTIQNGVLDLSEVFFVKCRLNCFKLSDILVLVSDITHTRTYAQEICDHLLLPCMSQKVFEGLNNARERMSPLQCVFSLF